MNAKSIHYKETRYGFEYGAVRIERAFSDDKEGWVVLRVKTPRDDLQVYVTKTGKVRVFRMEGGKELK